MKNSVIMKIFVLPPAKVIPIAQGKSDVFIFSANQKYPKNKPEGSQTEVAPEREQKDQ